MQSYNCDRQMATPPSVQVFVLNVGNFTNGNAIHITYLVSPFDRFYCYARNDIAKRTFAETLRYAANERGNSRAKENFDGAECAVFEEILVIDQC